MYGFGHICVKTFLSLKEIFLDKERAKNPFFVLPLKKQRFECPICGNRTLDYSDYYDICTECGWEDERFFDEDDEYTVNGVSPKEYREEYLRKKTEDPDYSWIKEVERDRDITLSDEEACESEENKSDD